jgi:hypothetical protein
MKMALSDNFERYRIRLQEADDQNPLSVPIVFELKIWTEN